MQIRLHIFVFFWGILCVSQVQGQDIEALLKAEKKVIIKGGINAEQIFYNASGITARREPLNYFVSGNLSISFLQWSVPLSFSFTNQVFAYQANSPFDFNQFSMQPSYRWVKLYLGYNSMNFSSYTMNGHIFLGAGVELSPKGHWAMSAMYGRFRKAVPYDENKGNIPYFERIGYGVKFQYNFQKKIIPKGKNVIESKFDRDGEDIPAKVVAPLPEKNVEGGIEFIVFAGKDNPNSIARPPDSLKIYPEQNLALSLHLNTKLWKHFGVDVEVANSALTRNIQIESDTLKEKTPWYIPTFIPTNSTTAYYSAMKGLFNYQADSWNLGLQYERVDPEYRTLGGYFFNNDLESIALNGGLVFFKKKINLSGSFGTQRNNLNGGKFSGTQRANFSVNLSYAVSQRFAFTLGYSNFQTVTRVRPQATIVNQINGFDNLDTLNFTQVSVPDTISTFIMFESVYISLKNKML